MSRWLVTGATGLLGSNASAQLSEKCDVVCSARTSPPSKPLPFIESDISEPRSREGLVERAGSEVVLHTAAVASIEACADDPDLAYRVNVEGSADLAGQAARAGADFIYISTDAVFDGVDGFYSEMDESSPISTYGRTKLEGENEVLAANPNALVARVNFYGWSPTGHRSLAEFFFRALVAGHEVPGFEDAIVSTLQVAYLIDALVDLIGIKAEGIVNVVSSESISKFDFGRGLASSFGLDPNLVVPARAADHLQERRSLRLELSTARVESLLGRRMPNQNDGLARLVAQHRAGLPLKLEEFNSKKKD